MKEKYKDKYKKGVAKAKFIAHCFIWLKKHKDLFPWKTYTLARKSTKHIYFFYCQYRNASKYYKKLRADISAWLLAIIIACARWLNKGIEWIDNIIKVLGG